MFKSIVGYLYIHTFRYPQGSNNSFIELPRMDRTVIQVQQGDTVEYIYSDEVHSRLQKAENHC
jgi:hypothetical protein